MTASNPKLDSEEIIHQFEQNWQGGQLPALERYAEIAGDSSHHVLVEIAHIDLEFRLKAGEPARAAEYLERYPQLAEDADAAASLILAECEFRRRVEPAISTDAIVQDYRRYEASLQRARAVQKMPSTPRFAPTTVQVPFPSPSGYDIVERLGEGGMGVVYKARDQRLGRLVALKFLPPEYAFDKSRLALFLREAKTASALNHPHICTVHDLAEHDSRPFIVLEFVEGRTVRQIVGEGSTIDLAAKLVAQAARALAVAHAAGVIHRDVKPENLMVRADGYLKVLDFGLAYRLPGTAPPEWSTRIRSGMPGVVGTVPYMSPEQGRGDSPGPASDVFSLGVVLYELMTGRNPFLAGNPLDTLAAISRDAAVPPSRLKPDVPPMLDDLVASMLDKDPANRPTAAEVDAVLSSLGTTSDSAVLKKGPVRKRQTVGRADERIGLRMAFERAAAGEGSMVCVVGEPGIGKTTFVDECYTNLLADGRTFHIARGRCSERLAEAEAYLPILEALDSLLQGSTGGAVGRTLRTLAPTWYAEMAPDTAVRTADGQAASQTRMKRELLAFLQELSRTVPVVLFVDDIHWSDMPTADLLAYLGRHVPGLRMLLVVAYRRDELMLANHPFLPIKQDLQARGVCKELDLELLKPADVERYLDIAFPGHAFPADLAATIHAKTGGNPLFVADLLRYLADRGSIAKAGERWSLVRPISDVATEIPESIRGLIRRKLDRLDASDRKLLSAAAVRGAEFDSAVLARGLGLDAADVEERLQVLDEVHRLVVLLRDDEFPDGSLTRRYSFVHALYQETLFAGLSPARRAALSRAQADALLVFHEERPGAAAAELALLCETGRQFGTAADLFHTAAENAGRVFAHKEAVTLARRGLTLLDGVPESREKAVREFHLQMTLGLQLQVTDGFAAAGAEKAYGRARELRETMPEVGPLFPILWGLWLFAKVKSDLARAQLLAGELLTQAQQLGDTALVLQAHQAGAVVGLCAGEPAVTRHHMESAARLYKPEEHRKLTFQYGQDPGVACLSFGSVALWLLGEEEEADRRSRESLRFAREGSQPSTLVLALHFAAMLHQFRGDPAAVREHASESLALAVEHRFAFWQAGATVLLGWAAASDSRPDGIPLLEQGLDDWKATGSETYHAYYLTLLADALYREGRMEDAFAALKNAERVTATSGERLAEAEIHRLRGLVFARHLPDAAEQQVRRAVSVAQSQRARALEQRALQDLKTLRQEG